MLSKEVAKLINEQIQTNDFVLESRRKAIEALDKCVDLENKMNNRSVLNKKLEQGNEICQNKTNQ